MRYLRLSLVAIALCAIAGYAAFARLQGGASGDDKPVRPTAASGPPGIAIVSAVAEHRDVPVVRRSVGWAEPISTVTVRARVEGEVIEQHVQEGQTSAVAISSSASTIGRSRRRSPRTKRCWRAIRRRWREPRRTPRAPGICSRARSRPSSRSTRPRPTPRSPRPTSRATRRRSTTDRIRLGYTQVRAPIDGRVGAVRVTPGNIVRSSDGGEGLVTVTQMKPLRVTFTLPERDLPALRTAQLTAASCRSRVTLHDGAAGKASGQLSFIDSSVDSSSGTITAKALLPNDDGALWPGQYVDVEVELGKIVDAVTDPAGGGPAGPGWPVRLRGRPGRQGRDTAGDGRRHPGRRRGGARRPPGRRPGRHRGPAAAARRQPGRRATAAAPAAGKPDATAARRPRS